MPLYQSSVLNKFLKQQDKDAVAKAYKKFSKHFHNPKIQENIRNSKEEQYQEGFLRELFVDVFGYTLNPQPNYNLTTELKNEKGSKKVDGAILKDGNAIGVIELKGTDTKDLEKVRQQAFDYKANQTGCVYVITSNFEKLRFYINNAVDFEEFDLFTINEQRFEVLYLSLGAENILNNIPLSIKEASVVEQENITKKFYADYSLFKRELFRDLVKKNLRNDVFRNVLAAEETAKADKNIKLNLFKKSQKLIDRFLFIFFAEDRGLLPPNSTYKILEDWNDLKERDAYFPLYDRFKLYFNYLDTGRKGTDKKAEIFAYNGGLFKPDNILDSLVLDDELLYKHTKTLSEYDFESQVDVNILGHIFENSLNEIESVNAEIEGTDFDKQKTKRKKDGVFYTPKYITKYIVDNTVGKLCQEKRAELGVIDEEFTAKRQKETKRLLLEKLEVYRAWLLELTICDPACGSGAFLNQALDFLIKEHESVDELQASLLGSAIVFQEIENTILEKNIYGVDLNEESVEIAKLSLWLRTAQPRRKLNSLNNNIKCGNSLIASKAVAGDKSFKWEDEFPEVFKNGGFDVIIGNPPYVRQELIDSNDKKWLIKNYAVGNGVADLYVYFYQRSMEILKANGILGFITPNKFYKTKYGTDLRNYLKQKDIIELIDFFELPVFEDASTDSQITIIRNQLKNDSFSYCPIRNIASFINDNYDNVIIKKESLSDLNWTFHNSEDSNLNDKFFKNSKSLGSYVKNEIFLGVKTAANNAFIIDQSTRTKLIDEDPNSSELIKKYVSATDIKEYHLENEDDYFLINTGYDIDVRKYPAIYNWLMQFDDQLKKRTDKGVHHFNLRACKYYDKFEKQKIMYIYTAVKHRFKFDESGFYVNNSCFIIGNADKFLSAFLNSSIFNYYKRLNFVAYGDAHGNGRVKLDQNKMKQVPIPIIDSLQKQKFEDQVDLITISSNRFHLVLQVFLNYIKSQFSIENFSRKMQTWYELLFTDFIKELNKAIKTVGGTPLTKLQEMEWMEVFETKKKEALELKAEIDRTDKEIDKMVYELYGLSEDEIKIVENS